MTINYAILGLLNQRPMTGYDLKKIIQDSSFMYWSGNNNQIYKALLALSDLGYVTGEVEHQDGAPSKKTYTITDDGKATLKKEALTTPELPEIKNPFMIQLAFADSLSEEELTAILVDYEQLLENRINSNFPNGSDTLENVGDRNKVIWYSINENLKSNYERELKWVRQLKSSTKGLSGSISETRKTKSDKGTNTKTKSKLLNEKEQTKMQYQIKKYNNTEYLFLQPEGSQIQSEGDAIDIISICAENNSTRILIDGQRIPDDFFRLRTGIAGAILQKLAQYGIKTVMVLEEERTKGRFKEFLNESNKGQMFRAYDNYEEAESWITEN